MTTAPPVSVVIPAYNNAQYIAGTIESVLGQSFPDLELLIADHGSRDSTWEIINSYTHDSRVRVISDAGYHARATSNGVGLVVSGPSRFGRANVHAESRAVRFGRSHSRATVIRVRR